MRALSPLEKQFIEESSFQAPKYFNYEQGPRGDFWNENTLHAYLGYQIATRRQSRLEGHAVLEIFEAIKPYADVEDDDVIPISTVTPYRISTRKIEGFKQSYPRFYPYLHRLIEDAKAGVTETRSSPAYRFGKFDAFMESLLPDLDCIDPVKTMTYTVIL